MKFNLLSRFEFLFPFILFSKSCFFKCNRFHVQVLFCLKETSSAIHQNEISKKCQRLLSSSHSLRLPLPLFKTMSVRSSLLPSTRSALRLSCRPGAPRAANQLRFNSTSTNQSKGNGPSPASGSAHTRGSTTSNLLLASIGSLALAGGLFLYSSTDSKKNL